MDRTGSLLRGTGGGRAAVALLASAALLLAESTSAQSPCVQVTNTSWVPSCPCDAGSELVFTLEGKTSLEANTVNLAIIMDASRSVDHDERPFAVKFAIDTVSAFAELNLFKNGGTASYAEFATDVSDGRTFTSQDEFDEYVEGTPRMADNRSTNIIGGIAKGQELLLTSSVGTTSLMVVITDGKATTLTQGGATDPTDAADAARAAGIIIFAVGVGGERDPPTLEAIAGGDEDLILDVEDFDQLGTALEGIVSASTRTPIECPATGATVTLAFNTAIAEASVDDALGSAVIGSNGTTVVFGVPDLQEKPAEFSVVLDLCGMAQGADVAASPSYTDTEENEPDLSSLEEALILPICGMAETTPPTPTPAPITTAPITVAPITPATAPPTTPAPVTPAPTTPARRTPPPAFPPTPSPPTPMTPAPVTAAPTTPALPTPPPRLTLTPATPAPMTPARVTPSPTTPAPSPTPAPATTPPATPVPVTPAPTTPVIPTPPPAPTPAPATTAPTTVAPTTPAPASSAPPTPGTATPSPATSMPPTPATATPSPATSAPATQVPGTIAPTTSTPATPATLTPAPSAVPPTPTVTEAPSIESTTQPTRSATAPPTPTVTAPPSPTRTASPSSTATSPPSPKGTVPPSPTATAPPSPAADTAPPSSMSTVQPSSASVVEATPTPTASARESPPFDSAGGSPEPSPTPTVSEPPTDAPVTSVASTAQEVAESAGETVSALALSSLVITTIATVLGGTVASSALGRSPNAEERGNAGARDPTPAAASASVRLPSATLAFVLVAQAQFLATLSLVDSTGAERSMFESFVDNLRWINLWPPASFSETFLPRSVSDDLEEKEGRDDAPGGMNAAVFLGNIALFLGLLMIIFVVHVAIASAIEAYWLTKKRAREAVKRAQRQGIPLGELSVKPSGERVPRGVGAEDAEAYLAEVGRNADDQARGDTSGTDVAARRSRLNLNKIVECREKSRSAWLHFPHVELVFMMFAFEGAVACQVSTIRDNVSPISFSLALATLLLFPALMLVMVIRTFWVKIRPDTNLVFKTHPEDDENNGGDERSKGGLLRSTRSFGANVHVSLKEKHSMFAWANKGQWESAKTPDGTSKRQRDWFRIGFEPIFVDFTKNGSWFVVYTLSEWTAIGVVGGMVTDSVVQLSLFCAMHTVSFFLLVILKPFANRVVNGMGVALCGINAVCMAILAVSASEWEGSPRADRVDKAVTITQLVTLVALIIPIYVDTSFMMIGALRRKCRKNEEKASEDDKEEREFTKRYVRRSWARMWWTMIGKNFLAFCHDTAAGIRYSGTAESPQGSTSAAQEELTPQPHPGQP